MLFFFSFSGCPSENCWNHKHFRLHGTGSSEPSRVFQAGCSRASSFKDHSDWAPTFWNRKAEGLNLSKAPRCSAGILVQKAMFLECTTPLYREIQAREPQICSQHLCELLPVEHAPFGEYHWKKEKNWKPLMSGEAWSVVISTFQSLFQVLLVSLKRFTPNFTNLTSSWWRSQEDGQSLVLWKNCSLCSPWLLKPGKTICVNLLFLKFHFRPICARLEHNDTWGDEDTWKGIWAGLCLLRWVGREPWKQPSKPQKNSIKHALVCEHVLPRI